MVDISPVEVANKGLLAALSNYHGESCMKVVDSIPEVRRHCDAILAWMYENMGPVVDDLIKAGFEDSDIFEVIDMALESGVLESGGRTNNYCFVWCRWKSTKEMLKKWLSGTLSFREKLQLKPQLLARGIKKL